MAMVNPMNSAAVINPAMFNPNGKDSRWLTLEVCREYTRQKCTRTDTECKFAHPPPHVEVQNGRVTCCFDSIKGKCQRKDPPCKYLHPPQHLKEQLLQNGRNNLILKNLQMQAMAGLQPMVPGMFPTVPSPSQGYLVDQGQSGTGASQQILLHNGQMIGVPGDNSLYAQDQFRKASPQAHPYLVQNAFSPYLSGMQGGMPAGMLPADVTGATVPVSVGQVMQSQGGVGNNQSKGRADRLEVCREFQRGTCTRQPCECRFAHPPENVTVDSADNHVTVCMDYVKGKCSRDSCRYFHPPPHLQVQIKTAQQRANAAAAQAQALPQVVEVLTGAGKKRPRDPADDLVLGMNAMQGGMVPMMKRPAVADSKSGVPVYQPNQAAYQQALAAMQLQQQPFVPVTLAGHPHGVPRF